MQVLIEPKNDLEKVEDAFGAKEELVGILETAQDANNTLSPIEVATLQLTMRQIDKGMDLPATETYHTSPEFFTTLAVEGLKENISAKWSEFVKAFKSIYKRFINFLSEAISKLKQRFSKKSKSTDQIEDDSEERREALLNKEYTVPKCWVDMGSEASADTLIERLDYLPKLLSFVDVATGQHGGVAKSLITAPEMFVQTDQWSEFTKSRTQAVLDYFVDELGATVNNQRASLSISDTVNIIMPLIDVASFPSLKINEDETTTFKLPENLTSYVDKLNKSSIQLFKKTERFINETKKIFNDEPDISKITNPEARKKIMELMPIYNKRLTLVNKTLKLSNATLDVAYGIVDDFNGTTTLEKESFYNEIDLLMLGTEGLKDSLQNKWKTFIAAIAKIYGQVKEFIKKQIQKLKNNFKRKKGEESNKFERDSETNKTEDTSNPDVDNQPSTDQQVVEKIKSYTMSNAFFEMNGEANAKSFIEKLIYLTKLGNAAVKIANVHDTRPFVSAAMELDDDSWKRFVQSKGQEVLDIIIDDLDAKVRGHEVKCEISENIYILMRLQNMHSYPEFVIDYEPKGTLEFPEDTKAFTSELDKVLKNTVKSLENFVVWEVPNFNQVSDTKAQERLVDLMPVYNKRAILLSKIGKLVTDCLDIGQHILADLDYQG